MDESKKFHLKHEFWASLLGILFLLNTLLTVKGVDLFNQKPHPWMLPLSVLALVWMFGVWLLVKPRGEGIHLPSFLLPLGIFFVYSGLSFFISSSPLNCWEEFIMLAGAFLAMIFAAQVLHDPDSQDVYLFWIGMAVLAACVYGLYQYFYQLPEFTRALREAVKTDKAMEDFLFYAQSGRIFSFFIYPNAFAGFLVLCLPPWFAWQWSRGRVHKLFSVGLLALGVLCLFMTGSVGAWFSLLLAVVIVVILQHNGSIVRKNLALIAMLAAVVVAVVFLRGWESWRNASVGLRLENWNSIFLSVAATDPLWGKGLGSFAREYLQAKSLLATELQYAHNTFLHWFAELGFTGFLLFVWFLWRWFAAASGKIHRGELNFYQKALFVSLLAFWIQSTIDLNAQLWEVSLPAWIFMGIFSANAIAPRTSAKISAVPMKVLLLLIMVAAVPLMVLPALSSWFGEEGVFLAGTGRTGPAIENLERAVSIDPLNVKQRYRLAGALFTRGLEELNAGQKDAGRQTILTARDIQQWVVNRDPDNAFNHMHLAEIHKALGDMEPAYNEYVRAIQRYPTSLSYWEEATRLAWGMAYLPRIDDLAKLAAKSGRVQPFIAVGETLERIAGKQYAVPVWKKASEKFPGDPYLQFKLETVK